MMKLAEALIQRQALKEQIARLRARLVANARVREGDLPFESPVVLFRQLTEAAAALERLEVRIHRTNVAARLPDEPEVRLVQLVARRAQLVLRREMLDELLRVATDDRPAAGAQTRYWVTVDVAALHAQVEALAAEIRALDVRLQAANWMVDLLK